MSNFAALQDYVSNLRGFEVDFVKKELARDRADTTRKLFSVLVRNLHSNKGESVFLEESEAMKAIKYASNQRSFQKLCTRFQTRLDYFITDPKLLEHDEHYARPRNRKEIMLSAKIGALMLRQNGQGDVLRNREYTNLLNEVLEYELYSLAVRLVAFKADTLSVSSRQEYHAMLEDIKKYERLDKAWRKAEFFCSDYFSVADNTGKQQAALELLQDYVEQLDELQRTTGSVMVLYWFYLLKAELLLAEQKFAETLQMYDLMIDLIRSSPSIRWEPSVGFAKSDIADALLLSGKFHEAGQMALEAITHFTFKGFNTGICYDTAFMANMYVGNYAAAYNYASEGLKISDGTTEAAIFLLNKRTYMKACASFAQGEFQNAFKLLRQTDLRADKSSFNFWCKVMEVLTLFKSEQCSSATRELRNLRKAALDNAWGDDLREREKAVITILSALAGKRWNPELVDSQIVSDIYEQLQSDENEVQWHIKSPEYIRFDWWLETIFGAHQLSANKAIA